LRTESGTTRTCGNWHRKEPVPVTGFEANFSPIPRIAPPPLGRANCGTVSATPADGPAGCVCQSLVLASCPPQEWQ
jgi:hypothetical protein